MAEKRRVSTRGRNESPAKKKRQYTRRASSIVEPSPPTSQVVEPLPSKIADSRPLPTIKRDVTIPLQPLQSISQSGVLAASLSRSRSAWLTENIFERYWIKPTKKKGQEEIMNNPPKDSMQKLGHCRMIIEPHVFDASLHTITASPPQSSLPVKDAAKSPGKGVLQLATPVSKTSESPQTFPTVTGVSGFPRPPVLAPAPFSMSSSASQNPASLATPMPGSQQFPYPMNSLGNPIGATSHSPGGGATMPFASPVTPVQPKPGQDPVIQMLAQRASTNSELKSLMKIVASGSATPEQLRIFQNHIDDLTAIIHRQKQATSVPPIAQAPFMGTSTYKSRPGLPSLFRPGTPNMLYGQPMTFHPPAPPPPKPKHIQQPKAEITGIAIEFIGLSTDRFTFPKNSIVEFSFNGKRLIASFLVVHKGTTKEATKHKDTQEYYQPVNVCFESDVPRILDTIAKTVNSRDEVSKYMEGIMGKLTPAEDVQLIMQLPSEESDVAVINLQPNSSILTSRRQSLLGSLTLSTSGSATPKLNNRKSPELEPRCRYCFAAVTSAQMKSGEQAVCDECKTLEKASPAKGSGRRVPAHVLPLRQASGARTLTMYSEAF